MSALWRARIGIFPAGSGVTANAGRHLGKCSRRVTSRRGNLQLLTASAAPAAPAAASSGGAAKKTSRSRFAQPHNASRRPWLWQAAVRVVQSELLRRSLTSIAVVMLLRLTVFTPLPGVDQSGYAAGMTGQNRRILQGALELPASIGVLGIGPYMFASIMFSVLVKIAQSFNIKFFEQWRADGDEGMSKAQRSAQLLGTGAASISAWTIARQVKRSFAALTDYSVTQVMAAITAGSCVFAAAANLHDAHGIGTGQGFVIATSIMAGYIARITKSWAMLEVAPPWLLPSVGLMYISLATAAVVLSQLELQLPLIHFRSRTGLEASTAGNDDATTGAGSSSHPHGSFGRRRVPARSVGGLLMSGDGVTSQLPLRVCPSGVFSLLVGNIGFDLLWGANFRAILLRKGLASHLLACIMVFAVVAITEFVMHRGSETPETLARTLLQMEAGLLGKGPGDETQAFLSQIDSKLALLGGVLMGLLAVVAHVFDQWCYHVVGFTFGTSDVLVISVIAASSITQVMTLWQETAVSDLAERESLALKALYD